MSEEITIETKPDYDAKYTDFTARLAPIPIAAPIPIPEGEQSKEQQNTLAIVPSAEYKFKDVDIMLREAFNTDESNYSTICDIIAMYLKGQKLLYTEAKTLCEQRLNYLMLPAIFVTALCTILSLVLKDYDYGATIVSGLNGFNAFLLALISYLKLDAKAEAHRIAAYRYDKLQSNLEFNSGKILFIEGLAKELPKIINETEANVREIKETNQFILPESIRANFPVTCSTNVFVEVKHIQNTEILLINKLKDILNEHSSLMQKMNNGPVEPKDVQRLQYLEIMKKATTDQIILIKDEYLKIDDMFEQEVEHQRRVTRKNACLDCLKT